jgi:hypothetical protein
MILSQTNRPIENDWIGPEQSVFGRAMHASRSTASSRSLSVLPPGAR